MSVWDRQSKRSVHHGDADNERVAKDELKEIVLQRLAARFWNEGPLPMATVDVFKEISNAIRTIKAAKMSEFGWAKQALKLIEPGALIEEFRQDGILLPFMIEGKVHFRFLLKCLHEYLFAKHLVSQTRRIIDDSLAIFIEKQDWVGTWANVWMFASGLDSQIAAHFILRFIPFSEREPRMVAGFVDIAAAIASENREPGPGHWVKLIAQQKCHNPYANIRIERMVSRIGGESAQEPLLKWLFDEEHKPSLVPEDRMIWSSVGKNLANAATNETRDKLISILLDPKRKLADRVNCAYTLGEIGDAASREALETCLFNAGDDPVGFLREVCGLELAVLTDAETSMCFVRRLIEANKDSMECLHRITWWLAQRV